MKAEMTQANCSRLYHLEEINIERDAELLARYGSDIPVLVINGAEAFRHRLTAKEFVSYVQWRRAIQTRQRKDKREIIFGTG
jgi:hypothetical protein